MGDHLATVDMGRKVGALLCPFPWRELGPRLTQCHLGRGLPPYQVVPDPSSHFATIDIGRKVGGLLCPFPWGESYFCI